MAESSEYPLRTREFLKEGGMLHTILLEAGDQRSGHVTWTRAASWTQAGCTSRTGAARRTQASLIEMVEAWDLGGAPILGPLKCFGGVLGTNLEFLYK